MSDTVLIIDDCRDFREIVSVILEDADFSVIEASCPDEAFSMLQEDPIDLIICDFDMPFTHDERAEEFIQGTQVGVSTIKEIGWAFPSIPIIAVSAATDNQINEARKQLGDLKILRKPVSPKILLSEIRDASLAQPSETEN